MTAHTCECGCGTELKVKPSQTFGGVWITMGAESLNISDVHVPGLIADLLAASRRVDS